MSLHVSFQPIPENSENFVPQSGDKKMETSLLIILWFFGIASGTGMILYWRCHSQ